MDEIRVDDLSEGKETAQAPLGHIRVWLAGLEDKITSAASIIRRLSSTDTMSLEVWDSRPPTMEKIEKLTLSTMLPSGDHLIIPRVPISDLDSLLSELQSESFGAWLNMDPDSVRSAAQSERDRDRVEAMPPNGHFIVFSLYDDNLEILGPHTAAKLDAEVRAALSELRQ